METYDVVIVGGGTNSLSIASYLGKCGLSVCICEERGECGGGVENTEPIPGYRIDPHATYLYGAAAPAFQQLELHKFGFRLVSYKFYGGGITSEGDVIFGGFYNSDKTIDSIKYFSEQDGSNAKYLFDILMKEDVMLDMLQAVYYTPPPPQHITLDWEQLPWAQSIKNHLPHLYTEEFFKMSTMDVLDVLFEKEPFKIVYAMGSWYNGPYPTWKGTGAAGLACNMMMSYSSGSPRGGMHSLAHALVRCAMHHGARIYTNSKVEEIIVEDGEAKGVILTDNATAQNRKIYATKAVISNTHVVPTFLDLIPSKELDADFLERVQGINIKGGSLFTLSIISKEMPKFIGRAEKEFSDGNMPSTIMINCDSRDAMFNMERDVYALNTHPLKPENMIIPFGTHDIFDPTRNRNEGHYVFSPIYLQVPPPDTHKDGPLAVNDAKDEIVDAILNKIREVAPNLTDDKIVAKFVNTPYDSSLRNLSFVGGNWMGISQEEEQWYEKKPLPELARYRTPIDKLYLCHQSSYPGGLALQAVSYNLMHILIEDLDLKPGDWWYPSKWFIPSDA